MADPRIWGCGSHPALVITDSTLSPLGARNRGEQAGPGQVGEGLEARDGVLLGLGGAQGRGLPTVSPGRLASPAKVPSSSLGLSASSEDSPVPLAHPCLAF